MTDDQLLHAARANCAAATAIDAPAITLGVEEELQVVDADGALAPYDFDRGQAEFPDAGGSSSRELHQCVLEIKTPVCASPDAAVAALAAMRRLAAARAQSQGRRVLSAGLHPFADWTRQPAHDDARRFPRFVRLMSQYGDAVGGALAFGMHVHLACTDPALRIPAMNALRNVLPEVLALSASSPFHEGRDTGTASWRQAILARLPRSGIPPAWRDEAAYVAHLQRLRATGCLDAEDGLWEDLRLHERYGTLEVRICDAVPSLDRVWLIVALLQAELATIERELSDGIAPTPIARELIAENKWRAGRHGLRAELVDWRTDTVVPMAARLQQWLERLAPAATRQGTLARMGIALASALDGETSAARQRAVVAHGSLRTVVDRLVADTAAPLSSSLRPASD